MRGSVERARIELAERLRARRGEIEQSALTRIHAIADPSEATDPEYAQGLRAAVSAALDYGLAGIEHGEERAPPVPAALLIQSHLAARNGVSLDTVLRRCLAGYTLLGDYLIEEVEQDGLLSGAEFKRLLRAQATLFDRLLGAVTEEHGRELEARPASTGQRRAERAQRLLDGELIDTAELEYDLDAHHLGVIAVGTGAGEAIRDLAKTLDRGLLLIRRPEGTVWAWLGARRRVDPEEFQQLVSASWPPQVLVAIGELAQGLNGWRLTHRQARAALPIALRTNRRLVRYADVALLASILQDDLLATSLRLLYLAPLSEEHDGGACLRETMRAYFKHDRNISSAAAALGVNRNTVANRLRAIETKIGRPLRKCATELETVLRLEELAEWRGSGCSSF